MILLIEPRYPFAFLQYSIKALCIFGVFSILRASLFWRLGAIIVPFFVYEIAPPRGHHLEDWSLQNLTKTEPGY
jgi:hypothetical protein